MIQLKKNYLEWSKLTSTSFKYGTMNVDKMLLMEDDIQNESYYTEKNSIQSFGICKRSEQDNYSQNSSIFEDNDRQKHQNQSVDIFTNRINFDQYISQNQIAKIDENYKSTSKIRKIRIKKKKKIKKNQLKIKNISKFNFESLALRNIKTNFATGLIQFMQFKQELMAYQNDSKQDQLNLIIKFMFTKLPALRSFSGWREVIFIKFKIWKDKNFGNSIRKLSILFFSKFFIYTYIQSSRVKQEYKQEYVRKIPKFIQGAKNQNLFNSYNFNL